MMIKAGRFFNVLSFSIFLFLIPSVVFAGVSVKTSLSDKNLEVNDQVALTIEISSDEKTVRPGSKFQPPEIKGLSYMGVGQSSSTNISFNGTSKTANYKSVYTITYSCSKEGNFMIPPINLDLPGGLKTQAMYFKVYKKLPNKFKKKRSSVASRGRSRRRSLIDQFMGLGGGALGGMSRDFNPEFFTELEVDKTTVFEGEQLIAKWYVYISDRTNMQNFDTLEFPTLRGFWKEDINFATRFYWKPVIKNGKRYLRSIFNSYALTPYNEGVFDLDSFKLRVVVSPQSFFSQNRKVLLAKSEKVSITVKPLPKPVPSTFFGGVGRFKVDSDGSGGKKEVLYAESFRHRVRVIGDRANTKFIKKPNMEIGKEFKVYNVEEAYEFIKSKKSSYKEFTYTLIPKKEGIYTPPQTKMTFLNPDTEKYYDLYIKSPTFKVLPNKNVGAVKDESFTEDVKVDKVEEKIFKEKDITGFKFDFLFFNFSYKIQFVFLLIFMGFSFWYYKKFSVFKESQVLLISQLEERTKKAVRMFRKGQQKKSLDELINIYSLLIGGVLGKRFGVEEAFDKATDQLPPSLRSQAAELSSLNENLQLLRFGSALESKENQAKLEECLDQFKILFSKIRAYLR